MPAKTPLIGLTLDQLTDIARQGGMPRFVGKQLADWLYAKKVTSFDQMVNISKKNRQWLDTYYEVGRMNPALARHSQDGSAKYLFDYGHGRKIESVYIPDRDKATLCVSSQVGCRMNCYFCATGRRGFHSNLSVREIINQILSIPPAPVAGQAPMNELTNVVFMGMGEPLDNIDNVLRALEILTAPWGFAWSPTRITVSTSGVTPALPRLLDRTKVHLAVSLHNPFSDERAEIMPVERAYPIAGVAELLRRYDFTHQRRVSFEYIVLSGLNDTPRHIRGLCRLLDGIKCRINLIRFHKIPGSPYFSPPDEELIRFRDTLTAKGIQTTIRASRGEDIQAACGLLSTREQQQHAQQ